MSDEVVIIVGDKQRVVEFEEFHKKLDKQIDYDKLSTDFSYIVLDMTDCWKLHRKKLQDEISRSIYRKNPAFALQTDNIIYIDKAFWEKSDEEKEVVLVHEYGHLKYPLSFNDSSFLVKEDNGSLSAEYAANLYLRRVSLNLIRKYIEFWFRDYKKGLDECLTTDNLWAICQNFFVLKSFQELQTNDNTQKYLKFIQKKLKDLKVADYMVKHFEKLIEDYLKNVNDKNKNVKLDEFYDQKIGGSA